MLRRVTLLVTPLILAATIQVIGAAPAEAVPNPCSTMPACSNLANLLLSEEASLYQSVVDCLNESPGPGHLCGNYLDLARTLSEEANDFPYECVDDAPGSPCAVAWPAIRNAEAGLLNCISLQTGSGDICGNYAALALTLIWSEYASVVSLYSDCSSGQNGYCATAFATYQEVAQFLANCVNMTPGTLCPGTEAVVEALLVPLARDVANTLTGCDVLSSVSSCFTTVTQMLDTISDVTQVVNGAEDPATTEFALTTMQYLQAHPGAVLTLEAPIVDQPDATVKLGTIDPPDSIDALPGEQSPPPDFPTGRGCGAYGDAVYHVLRDEGGNAVSIYARYSTTLSCDAVFRYTTVKGRLQQDGVTVDNGTVESCSHNNGTCAGGTSTGSYAGGGTVGGNWRIAYVMKAVFNSGHWPPSSEGAEANGGSCARSTTVRANDTLTCSLFGHNTYIPQRK